MYQVGLYPDFKVNVATGSQIQPLKINPWTKIKAHVSPAWILPVDSTTGKVDQSFSYVLTYKYNHQWSLYEAL